MERIAIVDLGTNTFHLMIVEDKNGEYQHIHKERIPVRLGKNGISNGIIHSEAIQRAEKTLLDFKLKLNKYNVERTFVIGTSAIRNARNQTEFVERIRVNTGFDITVIDGIKESEFIYKGVTTAIPISETALIVDIGGGSVEFIICNPDGIIWNQSFEIGAQRLLDNFHKSDPIAQNEILALETSFESTLEELINAVSKYSPSLLVGSSGTFDTLSEIYCKAAGIPIEQDPKELPLPIDAFITIHEDIIKKNRDQRLAIPGMLPMRVDMIVVASCLVRWIIDRFSFAKMRVSTYALKEGVLSQLKKTA